MTGAWLAWELERYLGPDEVKHWRYDKDFGFSSVCDPSGQGVNSRLFGSRRESGKPLRSPLQLSRVEIMLA